MDEEYSAVLDEFGRYLLEELFRSDIEDGSIKVGNRSFVEINEEFETRLKDFISAPDFDASSQLMPRFDHRAKLLDRANEELANGDPLISITFYVIWFEHFINGVLVKAFQRAGHEAQSYMTIVRHVGITAKVTAIWPIVGLPRLDDERIKLLNRAVEARNSFVHYKWPGVPIDDVTESTERTRVLAGHLPALVAYLEDLENQIFWDGREDELIQAFRAQLVNRPRAKLLDKEDK